MTPTSDQYTPDPTDTTREVLALAWPHRNADGTYSLGEAELTTLISVAFTNGLGVGLQEGHASATRVLDRHANNQLLESQRN